jgi:hypothetical protein
MTVVPFALACTLVAWGLVFVRVDRRIALALFVLLSLVGAVFVVVGGVGFAWDTPPPAEGPHRALLLHGALILAAQLVGFMRLGARSSQADGSAPTTRM